MLTPKERAEKIKAAPKHSTRILRKLSPEEHEKHLRHALEHDNDAGMSSADEYAFLKQREASGK